MPVQCLSRGDGDYRVQFRPAEQVTDPLDCLNEQQGPLSLFVRVSRVLVAD